MTDTFMAKTMIFAGLIGILCIILVFPILTIWSLNTLFPVLDIPYTVHTWLAALLLGGGISIIGRRPKK